MIRAIANAALKSLSGEFQKLYSLLGRESLPPERLMGALLLQAFYRCARSTLVSGSTMICCSAGLSGSASRTRCGMRQASQNRDRPLEGDIAAQFLAQCCRRTKSKRCCRASTSRSTAPCWKPGQPEKFRPEDGSGDLPALGAIACPSRGGGERDFHGEPRRNDTHVSTTDPEPSGARLFRKGLGKERGCASWATR